MSEGPEDAGGGGAIWKGIVGIVIAVVLVGLVIAVPLLFFAFGFTMGLPIDAGQTPAP